MREDTVALPDGRNLGYAEHGVPDGIPVLYFHGIPAGRFYTLDAGALRDAGVRLLTLERPGLGLSDPNPGRSLLDWPPDVAAFADAMGIDRFAVLGASMGGPSAVACGYALPDRVPVVGLVCAMGPLFDHPEFDDCLKGDLKALLPVARADLNEARELVREFVRATSEEYQYDPAAYFEVFVQSWSEVDQPSFRAERALWEGCLEATWSKGPDGYTEEVAATAGPWGFDPVDVRVPVRAWHGDADDTAPIEMIRWLVNRVPDGAIVEYSDEAHVLDPLHHADWLATLTAWAR